MSNQDQWYEREKNKIITRCLSPNKDDSTGADSESSNAY